MLGADKSLFEKMVFEAVVAMVEDPEYDARFVDEVAVSAGVLPKLESSFPPVERAGDDEKVLDRSLEMVSDAMTLTAEFLRGSDEFKAVIARVVSDACE